MMDRNEIILIVKSLLKSDKSKKLHFFLNNNRFYNGVVLDYSDEDMLEIDENMLGNMSILYSQIVNVEPFLERR